MIRFRKKAYVQEAQPRGNARVGAFNSAWHPDRPLPIPSNEWIDPKITPHYEEGSYGGSQ